ncbi:hypothetical protein HELRODRAFT_168256 [Helobdella robusta]|uniref:Uncharacterized protein n=1 Tax=Helobdella robusta TaxID=6412 RepID=T1F0D2_HELRO|nr:hypothetical protein HELRODRAFT_168256 [Helobdella robusta]ESO09294.1 hypothetical protein HELRODRAFT_168256 [Helobdella robusta]
MDTTIIEYIIITTPFESRIHLVNDKNNNCKINGVSVANHVTEGQNHHCHEKISKAVKKTKSMQTPRDNNDSIPTETLTEKVVLENLNPAVLGPVSDLNEKIKNEIQKRLTMNDDLKDDMRTFNHHNSSSFIRPIQNTHAEKNFSSQLESHCSVKKLQQSIRDANSVQIKTEPEDEKEISEIIYKKKVDNGPPSHAEVDCKFVNYTQSKPRVKSYCIFDNHHNTIKKNPNNIQRSYEIVMKKNGNDDFVKEKSVNENIDLQSRTPSSGSDSSTISSFENFKCKMDAKYTYEDKMKNYQKYLKMDSQIAQNNMFICRENYRKMKKSATNHDFDDNVYNNCTSSRTSCPFVTDRRPYKNNNFELESISSVKNHVVCPKGSGGSDSSCSSDTGNNKNQHASESLSSGDRDSLSSNSSNNSSIENVGNPDIIKSQKKKSK